MKKIILGIVTMVVVSTSAAFANTPNNTTGVKQEVEISFKKVFASATNTSWSKINDLYRAQFEMDGQVLFAFLNEDGELVGVYRNILSTQLPLQLSSELKQNYSDYWINDLFEVAKENHTQYYVTIENANHQMVLKSENGIDWIVYSKTKK